MIIENKDWQVCLWTMLYYFVKKKTININRRSHFKNRSFSKKISIQNGWILRYYVFSLASKIHNSYIMKELGILACRFHTDAFCSLCERTEIFTKSPRLVYDDIRARLLTYSTKIKLLFISLLKYLSEVVFPYSLF